MEETSPKRQAPRSIRLVQSPGPDGVGVFCVTAGKETAHYVMVEMPCAIGGRGFSVHKLGLGNLYHVRVGQPTECMCECPGFLFRNQCRHIQGLQALIREGKL